MVCLMDELHVKPEEFNYVLCHIQTNLRPGLLHTKSMAQKGDCVASSGCMRYRCNIHLNNYHEQNSLSIHTIVK